MHINAIPEGTIFDSRLSEPLRKLYRENIIPRCELVKRLLPAKGPKEAPSPIWTGQPDDPKELNPLTTTCPNIGCCPFTAWRASETQPLEITDSHIRWIKDLNLACEIPCKIREDAEIEAEKNRIDGTSTTKVDAILSLMAYLGFPGSSPVAG